MASPFFPKRPAARPTIYAYSDTRFPGMLKVGYTSTNAQKRVAAQYPVVLPGQSYKIVLEESAMYADGSHFTDHKVHQKLRGKGLEDASLDYISGLGRHEEGGVGLYDTVLTREEYRESFVNEE